MQLQSSLGDYITGVRYAWSASPCCPTIDRDSMPCPPNSWSKPVIISFMNELLLAPWHNRTS